VAAADEAEMLLAHAAGDGGLLDALVARRLAGEPLAWITGVATFCGLTVHVDPGVYVPRPHSEQLALRAAERLAADGVVVDVCTGSGAVAIVLAARRPGARVLTTDIDPRAVACARRNGVEAFLGDLFAPLPPGLQGMVDVVTGVVPHVPTGELGLLQRDTFTFESAVAYDGGRDGCDVLRRVIAESRRHLRPGGALLLELGGDEADLLAADLARHGYTAIGVLHDADGDVRGLEATRR
jgi:release factor glutamine methyltransferase